MSTSLVSESLGMKNPGTVYRPMLCKECNAVTFHKVDFIAGERSEKGRFVWFTKMCSGLLPTSVVHPHRIPPSQKVCGFSENMVLPLSQWNALHKGNYF